MLLQILRDESGFVISGELLIVASLAFAAAVVGFVSLRDSLVAEIHDLSGAVGAVSQSHNIPGIRKARGVGTYHGQGAGFGFNDHQDHCDCMGISFVAVDGHNDASGIRISETAD